MKTKRNLLSILVIMIAAGVSLLLLSTAFHVQLTGSEAVKPLEEGEKFLPGDFSVPFFIFLYRHMNEIKYIKNIAPKY